MQTTTVPNGLSPAVKLEPMSEMILRDLSATSSELVCTDEGVVKRACQCLGEATSEEDVRRLDTRSTAAYVKLWARKMKPADTHVRDRRW